MEDETQIAERRIEERKQIAITDALTCLPNREAYNQRGEEEINRWLQDGTPLCIVVSDIDFFKSVNDDYGHSCGDEVLKGVAAILEKRIRETDFVARFGGEEFVLLLPGTVREEAFQLMESVRKAVESAVFLSEKLSVSISSGIASFKGKDNLESAFTRADRALYEAKELGRNMTVMTKE